MQVPGVFGDADDAVARAKLFWNQVVLEADYGRKIKGWGVIAVVDELVGGHLSQGATTAGCEVAWFIGGNAN